MRNVAHANNELFNPLFYRCDMWSNAFNNFKSVQTEIEKRKNLKYIFLGYQQNASSQRYEKKFF